jgi:formamidopyrimidine-DNA glycosylase
MPELPEVETTTRGLQKTIIGKTIKSVWSSYPKKDYSKKDEIKDLSFFNSFKKQVVGTSIKKVSRRGKNILIHLDNKKVILVHMKLTGHFLFGEYKKTKEGWEPKEKDSPLSNPFSRHIRFLISFTDNTQLALSDMRTFAKITLLDENEVFESRHLSKLGPEITSKEFTKKALQTQLLKKPTLPIKTALMEQDLFVGVGNIYSDELLWLTNIHPERKVRDLTEKDFKKLHKHIKPLLQKGIDFQGDSTSDYRTIDGTAGEFQLHRNAYRKTGETCTKRGCGGVILRKVVRGRSAHYCNKHQK